jgi:hypothetical protein
MNVHFIGFQTKEPRSMLYDQTQENILQNYVQYLFSQKDYFHFLLVL